MNLGLVFSIILISFGAAALYLGITAMRKQYREYSINVLLGYLCFSSSIWSYGFAFVYITDNTTIAYLGRCFGLIGVFGFLTIGQALIGRMAELKKPLYRLFCGFSSLGFILYFALIQPNATKFYLVSWGMTYSFEAGIVSTLYSLYSVIYAVNIFFTLYYLHKTAKDKRTKIVANRLLGMLVIVFWGMILDTIAPMLGFGALPGSSLFQFLGIIIVYYAIAEYNTTRITVGNMSQYAYEFVSEPIMVFDAKGLLKIGNVAAKNTFANSYKDFSGCTPSIYELFDVGYDYLDFEGTGRSDESRVIHDNMPVQINTTRIVDKYGDIIGFILIIKDMTEINSMMDSLVEAKKLAEANNSAKSMFLANMSHEMRTPLNAIIGFSELLLKSELGEGEREQVNDIRTSSYNLLAIINDVLDISKIESNKMEIAEAEYNIGYVIKDAYLITNTLAQKKELSFNVNVDENIPRKILGDPVRIRGILVNVLNNAVKYTKEGSVSLDVLVNRVEDDTAFIKFVISDTGIGIKREDMDKLFEKFTQVDVKINSGIEGTGLGLSIVKGLIEIMSGTIDVSSKYGSGTTFTIIIPQQIMDGAPMGKIKLVGSDEEVVSAISDVRFSGVRVLAVDDNKVNLKVITKVLTKYEMNVTTADTGTEAIELCRNMDFDIIFMDQMMPVMDGVEAMKNIRWLAPRYASGGDCPIIALTANAITGIREELIKEGFDSYLPKPIDFSSMESMITDYIKTGRIILR